jgi:hypothetical protein
LELAIVISDDMVHTPAGGFVRRAKHKVRFVTLGMRACAYRVSINMPITNGIVVMRLKI